MGAEIATKLIEYIESENSTQDLWHTNAIDAAMHGTAMMKVVFDPTTSRIVWTPLTIFDCYLQNAKTPDDVKWCVIRSYIDQYDAWEMLKSVDPEASLPDETKYTDGCGVEREGVEKFEIWHLPGSRYKDGLFASIIGNRVVESMKYPYVFSEPDGTGQKALLPVVWWHARQSRDSTLGTSWTREATMNQIVINDIYSKNLANTRQAKQMLILPASLRGIDTIDEENARIYLAPETSAEEAGLVRWVQPAPIDPGVQKTLNDNVEGIYRTAGINESTTGNAYASQSGKALSYQAQLDSDKHGFSFKSLERAQKNAWELTLKLLQKYYTVPRQMAIAGQDPMTFTSADIQGVSLRLEPRSQRDGFRTVKQEKAREDIANGFSGKEALLDAAPTAVTAGMQAFARQLIESYLSGEDIDLTPQTISPEIFLSELAKYEQQALVNRDKQSVLAIADLRKQ
jgi:hypothetical protein